MLYVACIFLYNFLNCVNYCYYVILYQDYQTKSAIREMNGFPPILELLKSEFPVIQHLALVALQRATEDCK